MKSLSFKLFLVGLCAAMTGAIAAAPDRDATTLSQISTYREWTRVNSEPVKVEMSIPVDQVTPAAIASIAL